MFCALFGLTAIEVSLCGPAKPSQSVLALAPLWVGVEQIASPRFTVGPLPNTEPATGAGASVALCVKSTGWTLSPSSSPNTGLTAKPMPTTSNGTATRAMATGRCRRLWSLDTCPPMHIFRADNLPQHAPPRPRSRAVADQGPGWRGLPDSLLMSLIKSTVDAGAASSPHRSTVD